MKKITFALLCMSWMAACKKSVTSHPQVPHPVMQYKDLADTAVGFGHFASFDLDGNGEKDILFSTLLVGDPINQQDKHQWLVSTSIDTNLPVSDNETVPPLHLSDDIPITDLSGHHWYNASTVILLQKVIGMTAPPYWDGNWKDAQHRYVPVQIKKGGSLYNGWVELSFNSTTEKIILHRSAICAEANKTIKAGK